MSQSISTAPARSRRAIVSCALGLFAAAILPLSNGPVSTLAGLVAVALAFAALRDIDGDRATGRALALIGLTAGMCGVLGGLGSATTTPAVYGERSAVVEPEAQPAPAVNYPLTTFGEGTYLVGAEVAPGQYVTDGAWYCYWERAKDTEGSFTSIIAYANSDEEATVTINPSDKAFKVAGNCTFTKR